MGQLGILASNLRSLRQRVSQDFSMELSAKSHEMVEMQQRQLEDGDSSEDVPLEYLGLRHSAVNQWGTYSNTYSIEKAAVGGMVKQVDLKLTGQFHKSITAKVNFMTVTISANDPDADKMKFINTFYQKPIGLTSENIGVVMEKIAPKIMSSVVKHI